MLGRILPVLVLASAAAAVLAHGTGSEEIDFGKMPNARFAVVDQAMVLRDGKLVPAIEHQVNFAEGNFVLKIERDPPGADHIANWHASLYDKSKGCDYKERIGRAFARHLGYAVQSFTLNVCRSQKYGSVGISSGTMVVRKVGAAPPTPAAGTCKGDAYLGAWQRSGESKQKPQVQIVFATERGASAPVGTTRGFASAPYGDGTVIASRIRQNGDGCTFDAQCGANLSSANACKLVVDTARNTLTVQGGSQAFVSDRVWTRAKPITAETTCGREDVEVDWRRSDGANVPIVGVHVFKNGPGGNALLFNHPEGWWPKGQHKFTAIYRDGGDRSCRLKAVCATYDRMASGNVVRRERPCTLTIDPEKRRMTESGSGLFYTRDGGAAPPVTKPVAAKPATPSSASTAPAASSETEQAATGSLNAQQAATAKREMADYEARKKAVADEQAAKEAAYRKAVADREALIAENERKAKAAQASWEAAVAACKAGDVSQCGPKPKP